MLHGDSDRMTAYSDDILVALSDAARAAHAELPLRDRAGQIRHGDFIAQRLADAGIWLTRRSPSGSASERT